MKLPVNVAFHSDSETPLSLASRLASAMGYSSVSDLLGNNTTVRALARGDDHAVRLLSSWSGVPVGKLQRFAVPISKEAGEWRLGGAVFRKEMRVAGRFRFCPHCLDDDLKSGSERPQARPYERASWLTRAVTACTRHRRLLVDAPDDAPTSDVAVFVADGWHYKCDPGAAADEAELQVDVYVEGRIAGIRTASFIDCQEVHVLLMLFRSLGWFVHNRLQSFCIGGAMSTTLSMRALGFKIASEGREAIETVVKEAIVSHRPAAHQITEFFGPLVRRFRRNADVAAYDEIIGLFQNLVERYVPVGPGDRFVRIVERRQVHSVHSAARDYCMDTCRVRMLVDEGGLVERSDLSDRRVSFSVEDAKTFLGAAARSMTTTEVAGALGTYDNRVRDLIEMGLLPYSEDGVKGTRPYYRITGANLDRFRERLFDCPLQQEDGLVTLASVSLRKCFTQSSIIKMIMEGRLTRVARLDDSMTLGSLLVDFSELSALAQTYPESGDFAVEGIHLNMTEVRDALSTTDPTVTALVKHRVLPVEIKSNPRSRKSQPFVHRDDVDLFLDNHRSLHRIARGWRRNIALMRDELEQHGLKPIFETSGKVARYYRKGDLVEVSLLPPNA